MFKHAEDIFTRPISSSCRPLGAARLIVGERVPEAIITRRVEGVPEVVEDGVTGFFHDRDVEGLARRIQELIDNPEQHQHRRGGHLRVKQDFAIKPVVDFENLLLRYA